MSENVTPRPERPTDQWVTGDEPITGPQQSYLHTLASEAGEDVHCFGVQVSDPPQIDRDLLHAALA